MDTDIIGGFQAIEPNCVGCGKPLVLENAWMTDGCPCNHELGCNNLNETRWRLLMQLQQKQQHDNAALRAALSALTDPDPCQLDNHGYCQAHLHLRSSECPHAAAKRLMGEQ